MKITICCSIAFLTEVMTVEQQLRGLGHEVYVPETLVEAQAFGIENAKEWFTKIAATDAAGRIKADRMQLHFDKINRSDAILVLNYDKKGVSHYIGGNTLMEMGVAFWLQKPIYLLNPIPLTLSYTEEVVGLLPVVIHGDLTQIK